MEIIRNSRVKRLLCLCALLYTSQPLSGCADRANGTVDGAVKAGGQGRDLDASTEGRRRGQGVSSSDPCAALQCLNGAACRGGQCDCAGTGFDGATCAQNIDDCTSDLCANGGRCVDAVNKAYCDCAGTGFSGARCEVEATLRFVDVTQDAGVMYRQSSVELIDGSQYHACSLLSIVEETCGLAMTGGAAAGDYDNDGWVDLFVTRVDDHDLLFRNIGDGTFEDVSQTVGLSLVAPTNAPIWGDIDNDGDLDLYLTSMGGDRNYLYVNQLNPNDTEPGQAVFTEEAVQRGVDVGDLDVVWGTTASFGDYDRDGYIDLHTNAWREYEDSSALVNNHARLFRNRGAEAPGTFEDVTLLAGVNMVRHDPLINTWEVYAFTSTFADLDLDGWPDLAVTGDYYTSALFWNQGDGTFMNGTSEAGINGAANAMGSALTDLDGDGLSEWFISSIYYSINVNIISLKVGNRLYKNRGDRTFEDITFEHDELHVGHWAWATTFGDFDNDADMDLVLTNGMDEPGVQNTVFLSDPMRFWRNEAGTLVSAEVDVGLTDTRSGHGMLTFDYDRDGDLDLFIVHVADTPTLYRNDGGDAGGYLRVRLFGDQSNRGALGARVGLQRKQGGPIWWQEHLAASNYCGQNEPIIHFGLGTWNEPIHRLYVQWPVQGGLEEVYSDVQPNQVLTLREGQGP